MAYATYAQMAARFGAELDDLRGAGRAPAEGETADADDMVYDRVRTALEDASADIDAELATAWDLPLPLPATQYAFLEAIACDLARLRLYEEDPTKAVLKRADDASARLGQLVEGKRELIGATSGRVTRRPTAQFSEYTDAAVETRPNVRRNRAETDRGF